MSNSLCHGECRYGELVSSWIKYTICRRIVYNVQIYITIRWSQCCITVKSPAHRRASLFGPFFLRSFHSPDLTEGSRPIFFIRGSCKILEYLTLKDWSRNTRSCVRSRKSLRMSFSTDDTSARVVSSSCSPI